MVIDPFRFARTGEPLERVISLLPEGRLEGIIAEQSEVTLQLQGSRTDRNRAVLDGHISGSVNIQCQVCLETIAMPLDIVFQLYPVTSDEHAEKLQQEFEPIVIEDNSLALNELVTNELILSLPVAVSHIEVDGRDCAHIDSFTSGDIQQAIQNEKEKSPFAKLKKLKQKDS